ncbi:hypothetical protein D0S45_20645 [Marinifilum sp. JC120]|nr:hypothetical protein D0S45_20645 [Marinifilum sp. JC120]
MDTSSKGMTLRINRKEIIDALFKAVRESYRTQPSKVKILKNMAGMTFTIDKCAFPHPLDTDRSF